MKKKVAILGSTGSIGKSLIKILSKNKSDYEVKLLSAQKNCFHFPSMFYDVVVAAAVAVVAVVFAVVRKKLLPSTYQLLDFVAQGQLFLGHAKNILFQNNT